MYVHHNHRHFLFNRTFFGTFKSDRETGSYSMGLYLYALSPAAIIKLFISVVVAMVAGPHENRKRKVARMKGKEKGRSEASIRARVHHKVRQSENVEYVFAGVFGAIFFAKALREMLDAWRWGQNAGPRRHSDEKYGFNIFRERIIFFSCSSSSLIWG